MKRRYAILSIVGFVLLGACKADKSEATEPVKAEGKTEEKTEATAESKVRLKTNKGDIVIELNAEKAPITVKNFLKYVGDKHYDGTVFHRIIDGFMIQGGGMALDGGSLVEKPTGAGIKNESNNGLKNDTGTIAMARTPDPDSATAQFFINVKDNPALDQANSRDGNGYAVFGKVVAGMDVVDKIKSVPVADKGGHQNVPTTPVTIKSATLEK